MRALLSPERPGLPQASPPAPEPRQLRTVTPAQTGSHFVRTEPGPGSRHGFGASHPPRAPQTSACATARGGVCTCESGPGLAHSHSSQPHTGSWPPAPRGRGPRVVVQLAGACPLRPRARGPQLLGRALFRGPRVDARGICTPGIALEPTADHSPGALGVSLAGPALSWPARLALEKRGR